MSSLSTAMTVFFWRSASKAKVRQRLQAERANALLGAMLAERQKKTVIAVDNEIIQRFAPKGTKG